MGGEGEGKGEKANAGKNELTIIRIACRYLLDTDGKPG